MMKFELKTRRPVKPPNTILKSALGLNSLWTSHANIASELLVSTDSGNGFLHDGANCQAIIWNNVGLSSNWSIRSCGIYLSGLSWKIWRYQSVKWDWNLIYLDNFIPSPEIIHLFNSDNSFVCVMVVSWQLLSQSLIPLASVYSRETRYPPHSLLWPHHRGPMSQELKRQTCCMRSQPHERLWPPLLKLNLEMVS